MQQQQQPGRGLRIYRDDDSISPKSKIGRIFL
jgi:hypothetical protein